MFRWGIGADSRAKLFDTLEPWLPTIVVGGLFAGFWLLTLLVQ